MNLFYFYYWILLKTAKLYMETLYRKLIEAEQLLLLKLISKSEYEKRAKILLSQCEWLLLKKEVSEEAYSSFKTRIGSKIEGV